MLKQQNLSKQIAMKLEEIIEFCEQYVQQKVTEVPAVSVTEAAYLKQKREREG